LTIGWAGAIYGSSTGGFSSDVTRSISTHLLGLLHIQLSSTTYDWLHRGLRKLAHLSEYAIFGLLLYQTLRLERELKWSLRTALYVVLVAAVYSLTDEFHQLFVPQRHASIVDCGVDTLGAALGVIGHHARLKAASMKPWSFFPKPA
jgi:VanZ family protein